MPSALHLIAEIKRHYKLTVCEYDLRGVALINPVPYRSYILRRIYNLC